MRPRAFYAVYNDGRVTAIIKGAMEARKLSPHRAYKPFPTKTAAEEYAAWWNYEWAENDAAIHAGIKARIAAKFNNRT